jgi:WD40 repeat protein
LASVSGSSDNAILVIPGRQRGHIQLIDLNTLGHYWSIPTTDEYGHPISTSTSSSSSTTTIPNISMIAAHSGKLSCIALNYDGTKCATASEKGTLIRVFNTATGTLLNELRRGMDRAFIFSIAFNYDSTRLCISSDKGTIHIFNLNPTTPTNDPTVHPPHNGNRASTLHFMKDVLPKYFSSEWSFAHAKIITESQCLVAFEQQHTILGNHKKKKRRTWDTDSNFFFV